MQRPMSNRGGPAQLESGAPDIVEAPRKPPSRLLLVRHGQSTWNHQKRIQGQLDPPLSELGWEQARSVASRLRDAELAGFYSSDLSRARETAEAIAELVGTRPRLLPDLREVALGEWEGKTREELMAQYPRVWERWRREPSWDLVPGGEGSATFESRVEAAINRLFRRHPAGDVLVVTHGGVIQVAIGLVTGRSSAGLFPFLIENCSLTVLQRSSERTVVTAVNDTCHLN